MVISIKIHDFLKPFYCLVNEELNISKNLFVIISTDKGVFFGNVVDILNSSFNNLINSTFIRIADDKDLVKLNSNVKDARKAFIRCKELVLKYGLDMQLVDSYYSFDKDLLIIKFTSSERVDFRVLAKDMGSIFKTRIEFKQIGIRDKARDIGGLGPCGRKLCCSNFLHEFDSVSINMAKNQNLSLNPSKINGVCGRLFCCLKYENESYFEYRKDMPNVGARVKYNGMEGKVVFVDLLKKIYKFINSDNEIITVDLNDDCKK